MHHWLESRCHVHALSSACGTFHLPNFHPAAGRFYNKTTIQKHRAIGIRNRRSLGDAKPRNARDRGALHKGMMYVMGVREAGCHYLARVVKPGIQLASAAIFSRRCVTRSFASRLRTAM